MSIDLSRFLDDAAADIINIASRFYLGNPQGRRAMAKMAQGVYKGTVIRKKHEKAGIHIPAFLIASIASSCNLRCTGCYAWESGSCGSGEEDALTADQWAGVFNQASDAGISFILLAGGEPLMRRDVMKAAAKFSNIIYPVFTNGTLINKDWLDFFDAHRNIIPVLSIEGGAEKTDARRGSGVYEQVFRGIQEMSGRGILFGASITVTTENMHEVTAPVFADELREMGCGVVFYVEYVPVEDDTEHLLLGGSELEVLAERVDSLRQDKNNKSMAILSFPGDEEAMGGCLAAGRGFFHINPRGGAEPCPFSPYSEMNLKDNTLLEVLGSSFFEQIQRVSAAGALNHKGGCTLFQCKEDVEKAMQTNSAAQY